VGYSGGAKANPTYSDLGDHTETFQVDYDPSKIDYKALLKIFWAAHDPTLKCGSTQYQPIIFHHDDSQKALAVKSLADEEARRGVKIYTHIRPASTFYMAEDYHQKYYLSLDQLLSKEIRRHYPKTADLVRSTAAARINGYAGGFGKRANLNGEIALLGLSAAGVARLRSLVK